MQALTLPRWQPFQFAGSTLAQWSSYLPPRHVQIVPSLSLGGAEKIIKDLAKAWAACQIQADVVVLRNVKAEFDVTAAGVTVHRLGHLDPKQRIVRAAAIIKASGLPAYCHLTNLSELEDLWAFGCQTIPVVHNAMAGWKTDPKNWDHSMVPFIVACGETVAKEMRQHGVQTPIQVIRHVVPEVPVLEPATRTAIRKSLGADPGSTLIGMIGRIVPQKRYTRSIRLLHALRNKGTDAKLVIIGGTQGTEGQIAKQAVQHEINRLGLSAHVRLMGPLSNASNLIPAFDVFLNTSLYEGVSIATMEAVASGIPVVSAHVGGQAEAVGQSASLLKPDASDSEWVKAILSVKAVKATTLPWQRQLAAQIWPWSVACNQAKPVDEPLDALFVTSNLDVGGAQRSLSNLTAELVQYPLKFALVIAGPIGVSEFVNRPIQAGAEVIQIGADCSGNMSRRVGSLLQLITKRQPKHVVFWNMDAATKLALGKCLAQSSVKLCDVSPGPLLFTELEQASALAKIMSTDSDDYLQHLHALVSKYKCGTLPVKHAVVIPNGMPEASQYLPANEGPRPPDDFPSEFAVVTVGRLHTSKRPELLPLVAKELARLVPGASLSVVGGIHSDRQQGPVSKLLTGSMPPNLFFLGPDARALSFLPRFACFYMVSEHQGCPNASLEAMMAGIPIVANPDGGTSEQIIDQITGQLVKDTGDPVTYAQQLAKSIAEVLLNKGYAKSLTQAAKAHVLKNFSIQKMANSYYQLLKTTP